MKKEIAYFCSNCDKVFRGSELTKTRECRAGMSGAYKTTIRFLCDNCLGEFIADNSDGTVLGHIEAHRKYVQGA